MPQWWMIESVDPRVGDTWRFRVPAKSEREAVARLWRFGMITANPQPWQPVVDPSFRAAIKHLAEQEEMFGEPRRCTAACNGEVWRASKPGTSAEALLAVLDLEALPEHRHFVLQSLAKYNSGASQSTRLWACWQWLAEWPTFRDQWLRKDAHGDCLCIPTVDCPATLADELEAMGDHKRAKWMRGVVDKLDQMSHRADPPHFRLW